MLLEVAGFGLNVQDVFAGRPEQDKFTAALNPFTGVIVQVLVLVLFHAMLRAFGLHAIEKSPATGAAVVKLKPEV